MRMVCHSAVYFLFFFQAEDGIRDLTVTGVQTCALPISKALDAVDVQKLIHDVHDLSNLHKEKCPTCGSGLVVRSGRFGPFIACARYPDECRFTRPLRRDKVPDRPTDEICQEGGAPMAVKTGRYGEVLACTKLPPRKHTRPRPLGVKGPEGGAGGLAGGRTTKG